VYPREQDTQQPVDHQGRAKFGLFLSQCEITIQGSTRAVACELRHGKVEIYQKEE
jgi:hypothetical protein